MRGMAGCVASHIVRHATLRAGGAGTRRKVNRPTQEARPGFSSPCVTRAVRVKLGGLNTGSNWIGAGWRLGWCCGSLLLTTAVHAAATSPTTVPAAAAAPEPAAAGETAARDAPVRAPGAHTGPAFALGIGHGFGTFGLQASVPITLSEKWALGPFAGAGVFPPLGESEGHFAFAAGVLAYRGVRHRLLMEASFAAVGARTLELHGSIVATKPVYGPGVIVGYEFVAQSGFLVRSGVGAGLALDAQIQVVPLISVGVGRKW